MKRKYISCFLFIILLGLFLITRLWRLDVLPSGFNIDEAGMAYSSWSLAHFGVDRYLDTWPVYLKNFYGGQSPLYPYFCTFLLFFFDFSITLIRIPGVIFSLINLLFGMLICNQVYPDKKYSSLFCGLLLTICPYFIMASRFALDCNLMLGASTLFLFLFINAITHNKTYIYFLAGIAGGIVLYSYALSYIILPLFLLISLFYLLYIRKFHFRSWFIMGIPLAFMAFPLLLEQYVNAFHPSEMTLGIFTFTKMDEYRASEFGLFSIQNFLSALKSVFWEDGLAFNSTPQYLTLYIITIPLFIIGFLRYILSIQNTLRKRELNIMCFPFIWFLAVMILHSHVTTNVNKINSIFFVVILIAVEGAVFLCEQVPKFSVQTKITFISALYLCFFLSFGHYYYNGRYTAETNPLPLFDIIPTEAIAFLEEHPEYQNSGTYMAENKLYYALATLASPYELNFELDDHIPIHGYYCGSLPEINTDYNYIVRDIYFGYADELRSMGYTEIKYTSYSLFYME